MEESEEGVVRARAVFAILEDDFLNEEPLVIKDVGPHDKYPTITNDAEAVVWELVARKELTPGRRLFYIDSEGNKDEILIKDGKFAGFALGPVR